MKVRVLMLGCLIAVVALSVGYEYSWGASETVSSCPRIAVVNIRKVFQGCQRNVKYKQQSQAEQQRLIAELGKLSKEIEAAQSGLQALKPDSTDYMNQYKDLLQKQADLQAKQKFYKAQMDRKDQQWAEQLYRDILRVTGELAKEKGFDLVLGEDEVELSGTNANELMLTIRTNKVLYSGGCEDISDEVTARLDAQK